MFFKETNQDRNGSIHHSMTMGEILQREAGFSDILSECGMHCLDCPSSQRESLEDACAVHGIDTDIVLQKLNADYNK